MTRFLGVDPGKQGCFAFLDSSCQKVSLFDMPLCDKLIDHHTIYGVIKQVYLDKVKTYSVFEKPQTRPTDGKKGIATFHWESGVVYGILIAMGHPCSLIPPQIWTKEIHKGLPKDLSAKRKSAMAFKSLFPRLANDERFFKGKKVYDGRIDAVLIAEYARRVYNGQSDR